MQASAFGDGTYCRAGNEDKGKKGEVIYKHVTYKHVSTFVWLCPAPDLHSQFCFLKLYFPVWKKSLIYVHAHTWRSKRQQLDWGPCVWGAKGTALNSDQQNGDQEETAGTDHFCVNTAYLVHLCGLLCMCIWHLSARVTVGISCSASPVLGLAALTCSCLPSIRIAGFGGSLKLYPLMKWYAM